MLRFLPIYLFLFIHTASAQPQPDPGLLIAAINETRANKDSLLAYGSDTPMLRADLTTFTGLEYYPIDLQYRLVAEMHVYGRQRQIEVPDTGGSTITMERFGRLYATWRGKEFWLEVYRGLESGVLEAFFKDQTNDKTTYSGGRYVRIEQIVNGFYIADFNMAYNPYCDYNPGYICPMPPPQNYLPFAVEAGELDYGTDLAH
ncbi:MAG: DUF1684 domain-containing protein [Candidatus Latescibacterota bacterium]|jgi:uncharacterized protein (DUF1684 family)